MPSVKSHQQHPGASTTMLSTADDTTAFSTAHSRSGAHTGRNVMHETQHENLHALRGRQTLEEESSFGTLGRGGIDIYATDAHTADIAQNEGDDRRKLMGSHISSQGKWRSRSGAGAGGSNSLFSSFFSMFGCCRAPGAEWDEVILAESPELRSVARRSGSAPPATSPRTQQQQHQLRVRPGMSPASPLSPVESPSDSEQSLRDGPQLITGGSSTQRSGQSTKRPSSVATVVAPSTPPVDGASPPGYGASGERVVLIAIYCPQQSSMRCKRALSRGLQQSW